MQREQKLDFTIRQKQRAVSMDAVAVIGACSPFNSLISNLFGGMASGAGFYFSRCVGSGQKGETKQAFQVQLVLGRNRI